MEIAERQKLVKKLAIIVIPVLVLVVGYFKFFYKGESEAAPVVENSSAVLDMPMDAKNVNRDATSKWDSYSMEDSINQQKQNDQHISARIDIDDFLNVEDKPVEPIEEQTVSVSEPEQSYFEPAPSKRVVKKEPTVKSSTSINVDRFAPAKKKENQNKIGFSDEQKKQMFGEDAVSPVAKEEPEKKEPESTRRKFHSSDEIGSTKKTATNIKNSDEYLPVVVHNDQVIKSGSTVRLRVTKSCVLDGIEIPKNTYISGLASLQSERVILKVNSIKLNDQIIKTKLSAFEEDGIEGVYVPGGINQEMANQTAQDATGKVGASINVPMFGSISVGGKRKIADPTVKIISGYKLLLKDATN